jgi:hypothetical protein
MVAQRSGALRAPVEIAYTLVLQEDGCNRVRITAENSAPIIVGDFLNKREAQAWINAGRAPVPDQPSRVLTPFASNRIRRWRAKAEEIRTAAESMTSESARRTFLQIARDYEALADSWEIAA